jgi:hypothetical protein
VITPLIVTGAFVFPRGWGSYVGIETKDTSMDTLRSDPQSTYPPFIYIHIYIYFLSNRTDPPQFTQAVLLWNELNEPSNINIHRFTRNLLPDVSTPIRPAGARGKTKEFFYVHFIGVAKRLRIAWHKQYVHLLY